MQRVYGTAFFSDKELQAHLQRIEEAKKRDHRKLGQASSGSSRSIRGRRARRSGCGKGTTLYNTLANYMRGVLFPAGYQEVKAPIIFNKALWETSGHWEHYRENMFLVKSSDDEEMALKAMNCPGHFLVFASEMRSYKDLPLRFHEQTPLHRNEASGVLSGLTRVRQFSQDDAHCFVMESQIAEEVERLLRLVQRVYGDFGLHVRGQAVDPAGEVPRRGRDLGPRRGVAEAGARSGEPALHDQRRRRRVLRPEARLRRHRRDRPAVAVRDDPARLPDAGALRPEVRRRRQRRAPPGGHPPGDLRQLRAVHRHPDRALRRRVPAVAGAGAGDRAADCRPACGYAATVRDRLAAAGLRVELDARQEKIGYKIREAQLQKIPYMLVTGDREVGRGHGVGAQPQRRRPGRARRSTSSSRQALAEMAAKGEPDGGSRRGELRSGRRLYRI